LLIPAFFTNFCTWVTQVCFDINIGHEGIIYTFFYYILIIIILFLIFLKVKKNRIALIYYCLFIVFTGTIMLGRIEMIFNFFFLFGLIYAVKTFFIDQNTNNELQKPIKTATEKGTFFLTVGVWTKIVPLAGLISRFTLSDKHFGKSKKLKIILIAFLTSAPFLILFLFNKNILSFLTIENTRNIQIESIFAIPFIIYRFIFKNIDFCRGNTSINMYEIIPSPNTVLVGKICSVLLFLSIIFIIIFIYRYVNFKKYQNNFTQNRANLFLQSTLLIVLAMIIFNKTGSPQYSMWLFPVVVVAILLNDFRSKYWNKIIVLSLVQSLYMQIYFSFIAQMAKTLYSNGYLLLALVIIKYLIYFIMVSVTVKDIINR
jgi:hypothetical protein